MNSQKKHFLELIRQCSNKWFIINLFFHFKRSFEIFLQFQKTAK